MRRNRRGHVGGDYGLAMAGEVGGKGGRFGSPGRLGNERYAAALQVEGLSIGQQCRHVVGVRRVRKDLAAARNRLREDLGAPRIAGAATARRDKSLRVVAVLARLASIKTPQALRVGFGSCDYGKFHSWPLL